MQMQRFELIALADMTLGGAAVRAGEKVAEFISSVPLGCLLAATRQSQVQIVAVGGRAKLVAALDLTIDGRKFRGGHTVAEALSLAPLASVLAAVRHDQLTVRPLGEVTHDDVDHVTDHQEAHDPEPEFAPDTEPKFTPDLITPDEETEFAAEADTELEESADEKPADETDSPRRKRRR